MLSRAIVEEIVDRYHVRVRIPMYNLVKGAANATPTDQLYIAPICSEAGNYPALVVGDIVFVGYENDQTSQPIVLGCLYRQNGEQSATNINANSAKINIDCILPENTVVGTTSSLDIKNLSGTTGNIQQQLNALEERIRQLEAE